MLSIRPAMMDSIAMAVDWSAFPNVPESRQKVRDEVDRLFAMGERREVARGLTKLSWLVRWFGHEEGDSLAWAAAHAEQATGILREFGRTADLAAALRAGAFFGPEAVERLREALEISRETGDVKGEADALASLGRLGADPNALADAERLQRQSNDWVGLAHTLISQMIGRGRLRPERRLEILEEVLAIYREAGARKGEYRACYQGALFLESELSIEKREALLLRALELASTDLERSHAFRWLKGHHRRFGNRARALYYAALEDSLDAAAYGSRRARVEMEIEVNDDGGITGLPRHGRASFRKRRLALRRWKAELARLSKES